MVDDYKRGKSFESAKKVFADYKKLEEEQIKLAKQVIKQDAFSKLETIGGLDAGFHHDKIYCSAVICDYKDMRILETQSLEKECKIHYIPGFRAQRELSVMIDTFNKLKQRPDILLINASGMLHPRKCGLASHLGIMLDQPVIGITKTLLCGRLNNDEILIDNEIVGRKLSGKDKRGEIYVSVGHKISVEKSSEIVKNCMRPPPRMPEPLHLAKSLVRKNMRK
jgi:deoxyribonuclease V